jgi:hypothetical protein
MDGRKKVEETYPITRVTYPDGQEKVYVSLEDVQNYTPPYLMPSLNNFMNGQTAYIEGYFPDDIEGWLNHEPVID